MLRKLALAGAGMALVATPLAAEQVAAELSRDTAPIAGESELAGQSTIFYVLGIAAVVAAVILLAEDDDDDPVSV